MTTRSPSLSLPAALGHAYVLDLCAEVEASIARNAELADLRLPEGWARALARNLVPALLERLDEAMTSGGWR